MRLYEREDSGSVSVSRANQAAAFAKISRSILSFLFSRRRRRSSARSSLVRPSSRLPLSRSSCLTPLRMACSGRLELFGQGFSGCGWRERGRPSAHLRRWIRGMGSGHVTLLSTQEVTCPLNRVNSNLAHKEELLWPEKENPQVKSTVFWMSSWKTGWTPRTCSAKTACSSA